MSVSHGWGRQPGRLDVTTVRQDAQVVLYLYGTNYPYCYGGKCCESPRQQQQVRTDIRTAEQARNVLVRDQNLEAFPKKESVGSDQLVSGPRVLSNGSSLLTIRATLIIMRPLGHYPLCPLSDLGGASRRGLRVRTCERL